MVVSKSEDEAISAFVAATNILAQDGNLRHLLCLNKIHIPADSLATLNGTSYIDNLVVDALMFTLLSESTIYIPTAVFTDAT